MSEVHSAFVISQNGQVLSVEDECLSTVGDIRGRILRIRDDDQGGVHIEKCRRSLLRDPSHMRVPNAGLFPALQMRSAPAGISLQRRIAPALRELPLPVTEESAPFSHLTRFIHSNPLGRVSHSHGLKNAELVAAIATAFPSSRIVVLDNRHVELIHLQRKLTSLGIAAVKLPSQMLFAIHDELDEDQLPRICLCTPFGAADLPFSSADIVVVLDAKQVSSDRMKCALSQMDARFRLYGFTSLAARPPSPSEEDAAFAVFGPTLLELHSPFESRRETSILWAHTPSPQLRLQTLDRRFSEKCYWRNERRNRRISQLARALYAGETIPRHMIADPNRPNAVGGDGRRSVTILVDRPAQAAEISNSLPEWRVLIEDSAMQGLCDSFRRRVEQLRRRWFGGTHQIVLVESAANFRGQVSDVLIWAGGGRSIAGIPDRWFSSSKPEVRPLMIIDFTDRHNPDARQMSRQRQEEYLERGIFRLGTSGSQGRTALFLSRQGARR